VKSLRQNHQNIAFPPAAATAREVRYSSMENAAGAKPLAERIRHGLIASTTSGAIRWLPRSSFTRAVVSEVRAESGGRTTQTAGRATSEHYLASTMRLQYKDTFYLIIERCSFRCRTSPLAWMGPRWIPVIKWLRCMGFIPQGLTSRKCVRHGTGASANDQEQVWSFKVGGILA